MNDVLNNVNSAIVSTLCNIDHQWNKFEYRLTQLIYETASVKIYQAWDNKPYAWTFRGDHWVD